MSVVFLSVSLTNVTANASVRHPLFGHGLSEPCFNCMCQMLLMQKVVNQSAAAVSQLRAFRLTELGSPLAEPGLKRNFLVKQDLPSTDVTLLAQHVRGIEVWTESRFQERAAEPKIAAVVLSGSAEIEQYYQGVAQMRELLEETLRHDYPHTVRMIKRMGFANFGSAALLTLILLDFQVADMQSNFGMGIPWWMKAGLLGIVDPITANMPRFRRDRGQTNFNSEMGKFLNEDPEYQRQHWIFSSDEYRVNWNVIDAVWSKDSEYAGRAMREQEYLETFGPVLKWLDRFTNRSRFGEVGRIRNRNMAPGWVFLDRMLRVNPDTQVPELVLVVRTIANTPRTHAPVTDSEKKFEWTKGLHANPIPVSGN